MVSIQIDIYVYVYILGIFLYCLSIRHLRILISIWLLWVPLVYRQSMIQCILTSFLNKWYFNVSEHTMGSYEVLKVMCGSCR